MNTLAKLIASVAALIASLALAWIATQGVHAYVAVRTPYPGYPGQITIHHDY